MESELGALGLARCSAFYPTPCPRTVVACAGTAKLPLEVSLQHQGLFGTHLPSCLLPRLRHSSLSPSVPSLILLHPTHFCYTFLCLTLAGFESARLSVVLLPAHFCSQPQPFSMGTPKWDTFLQGFNAMVHMGPAFNRSQAPCTPALPLSVHSSRLLGLGPSLDLCFSIYRMVGSEVRRPLGSLDHPVVPRSKLRCRFPWHGLSDSPCRCPWHQMMGAEPLLIISF